MQAAEDAAYKARMAETHAKERAAQLQEDRQMAAERAKEKAAPRKPAPDEVAEEMKKRPQYLKR
jgi:hypothetical protein